MWTLLHARSCTRSIGRWDPQKPAPGVFKVGKPESVTCCSRFGEDLASFPRLATVLRVATVAACRLLRSHTGAGAPLWRRWVWPGLLCGGAAGATRKIEMKEMQCRRRC
eukprot:gene16407-biopygen12805